MQRRRKKKSLFKRWEKWLIILVVIIVVGSAVKASEKYINGFLGDGKDDGCPEDMVFVGGVNGGFCIDRYEVSAGERCPIANPMSQMDTRKNNDTPACVPVSRAGAMPWTNVSRDQAEVACVKAGKRLPTNQEWYFAAIGTPDSESGWTADDCQVSSNWAKQPGGAGDGENCKSSAGAYDMIGNVWEWVSGTVQDGAFNGKMLPEEGYIDGTDGESMPGSTNVSIPNPDYHNDYFWLKNKDIRGIARGGYWNNKSDAGVYSVYVVSQPSTGEFGIGFRCVK